MDSVWIKLAAPYRITVVDRMTQAGVAHADALFERLDRMATAMAGAGLGYHLEEMAEVMIRLHEWRDRLIRAWEQVKLLVGRALEGIQKLAEAFKPATRIASDAGQFYPLTAAPDHHRPPTIYAGDNGKRSRAPSRKARNLARLMTGCRASDM